MAQGHHPVKKHTHKKGQKVLHAMDKLMYVIALIAPAMTIPQLIQIWQHHSVQGVSLLTWGAYALVSFLWLAYGILHKDKAIIVSNSLLFLLDGAITAGVLLFH